MSISSYSLKAKDKREYRKRIKKWNKTPKLWGRGSQAIHSERRNNERKLRERWYKENRY